MADTGSVKEILTKAMEATEVFTKRYKDKGVTVCMCTQLLLSDEKNEILLFVMT